MLFYSTLAKRYAQLFLATITHALSSTQLQQLQALIEYLNRHHEALFYVKLASIETERKKEFLKQVYKKFGCNELLDGITDLLAERKNLSLLAEVLSAIRELYKEQHGIVECTISTAHALTEDQHVFLDNFIKRKTNATRVYSKVVIDESLLAGIRILGSSFLWEHSIRKKLRALKGLFQEVEKPA